MTTDWRALCAELTQAIESESRAGLIDHDLMCAYIKATEALAQPEPVGPTDEELAALAEELDDLPVLAAFAFARAVLARWGGASFTPIPSDETTPMRTVEHDGRSYLVPVQPAPVEVTDEALMEAAKAAVDAYPRSTELPYFLEPAATEYEPMLLALRAAAALGSHGITPIPVSERLPGADDCDESGLTCNGGGWCWWFEQSSQMWVADFYSSHYSHWLPFHALPLPGQPATAAPKP